MDTSTIARIGQALFEGLENQTTIPPLTAQHPDMSIEDAYRISREFLRLRQARNGERVVGKKIGVTSPPVQEMLGVFQPDFGFLTDAMWVNNGEVSMSRLIAPRAEAEIAFRLAKPLQGPGITPEAVLDATETVMPCFEIVDSRIKDWRIRIEDTIADNASCGVFLLGAEERSPEMDLAALEVVVEKNGEFLSRGSGSAVQGAPQNAVAWLANTLGEFDISLEAGEIVLSGSLVPLAPAAAGDVFALSIEGLGSAEIRFTK